jgi:hypothetical protein
VITFIIFGIAAVTVLEIALCLVLLGLAAAEFASFLRHHPRGAGGGLRQLAAGARHIWPAPKNAAKNTVAGRWVAR